MQYEANSQWVCNSKVYCNCNYYGNEKTTITNNKLLKQTTYSNRICLNHYREYTLKTKREETLTAK